MPQYTDHWYKSRYGLSLYARDYPCDNTSEQPAATIVCIPGLTRNSADFDLLSKHLKRCFRTVAVDLRGRGRSEYDPCPSNYSPEVYAHDVLALLDSLKLESVILIGTSLGGLVAMILTALEPGKVASVVLNDIGPEANQAGLERIKSYVRNRSAVGSWDEAVNNTRQMLSAEYPNFSKDDWVAFTRNIYRVGEDGVPRLDYDSNITVLMEQQEQEPSKPADLWSVFAAMESIPTLLIRGALSDIITEDCVARMRKLHPGLAYTQVPGCGHAPLLTEPECLEAIDRFLA